MFEQLIGPSLAALGLVFMSIMMFWAMDARLIVKDWKTLDFDIVFN